MAIRTPGRRGRLPVKPRAERFPLEYLGHYLTAPLAAPTYPADVTGGIAADAWGMLGNGPDPACERYPDGLGDCSFAGRQHNRMAKAACYGETETWETSDDLAAEYLKYDHGQDVGANLADLLLYWYRKGRILAFAPVDHADPAAVDAAMEAFRGVYVGVNLTDDADHLFGEGQPWTVAGGQQPDPSEGHCIVKVTADGHTLDGYVTWGAIQEATVQWTSACLDEAWVIITTEDEAAKVDMATLRADIDALHGTGGDEAGPVPVPAEPVGLLRELAAKVREVAAGADRDLSEVTAWLHAHGL